MDIYNVTNFISIKQNKIAIRTQHTVYKHVNDYYFCCYKSNFFPAIPHEIRKVASKFRYKDMPGNDRGSQIIETYGKEEAHEVIKASIADYSERFDNLDKLLYK